MTGLVADSVSSGEGGLARYLMSTGFASHCLRVGIGRHGCQLFTLFADAFENGVGDISGKVRWQSRCDTIKIRVGSLDQFPYHLLYARRTQSCLAALADPVPTLDQHD